MTAAQQAHVHLICCISDLRKETMQNSPDDSEPNIQLLISFPMLGAVLKAFPLSCHWMDHPMGVSSFANAKITKIPTDQMIAIVRLKP